MRTCERCGGQMRPFVARRTVGGKKVCEGCASTPTTGRARRSAGFKNLAALENPVPKNGRHPEEWFHGSPHDFEHFGDPADHQDPEMEEYTDRYKHWNTLVGNHFASDHAVAKEFSGGDYTHSDDLPDDYEGPMGHVVHVKLHLKNPKVYASEHDMDQEVYEHEWENGNHHDKHMDPPPEDDDEYEEWAEEYGHRHHYAGDSQHKYSKNEPDPNYAYGFHPKATGWLNTHPDKEGIVQRYKDRMKRAGYDGVVYGNEYEGGGKSAIAFEPHQIEITQHHYGEQECLHPDEAKRRAVHPDQQVLPGLEDVKRKVPERQRPDLSKHWPTTFTPSFTDNIPRYAAKGAQRHDTGRLWAPLPRECWDRYYGRHTGAQRRTAKSWTMKYTTYGSNGGYVDKEREVEGPLYHGSRSKRLREDDLIVPGRKANSWGDEGAKSKHVFFTENLATAQSYADDAGGHVYEVEPTGEFHTDYNGEDYKTPHPLRVVRKVTPGKTAASESDEERRARIMRIREERKRRRNTTPMHKEVDENGVVHYRTKQPDLSAFFTPIPEEELKAQRERAKPKSEPIDDRTYSLKDVSRRYGWEGFDEYEISHLVHQPAKAMFSHEDVPVYSLRLMGENGRLRPPVTHQEIADQGEDEQERLESLKRGYDQDANIPPIVVVRHGEHHIIADGSHRAAIAAERGDTHIPAFVTERTKFGKTSALGEESARQHAGQQDVYAVRSGNTMVNLCAHHRDVHLNNARAADALGDQLGLSGRERSAESLGEARKGSCAACNRDTSYQLKLLTPGWVQNAMDSRTRRRPNKPLKTRPLPTLRQSENVRFAGKGDVFHADTGYRGGVRFHPDGTPRHLGDHTVPAGAEVHDDENEAWNKAIEHWNAGRSDFPRVYVVHQPKVRDGKLTHEADASELDYDHEKHPAIRSDNEEPHEPIMYHGTTRYEDDDLPEEITPSGGSQSFGPGVADPDYAYATPSLHDAWTYADKRSENGLGGKPTVYRVTPHKPEDVEKDPTWAGEYSRGNNEHDKRSKSGFEVLDEVPMSQRQEHEWRHSPFNDEAEDEDYGEDDHHFGSLKTLAEWDDEDDDKPEWCEECGEEHTPDEGHRECAACGERHEDYEDKDRHESTMTDWDDVYPRLNSHIHRVLPHMTLPDHVHEVVHDESRPMAERGQALLDHVAKEDGRRGLGMHWSDVFGEGRGHGADKFAGVGGGDERDTQVVLHARKPDRDDIETDPDTLDEHQVFGYDVHDENEVPIQQRAPVHITGVSWRPGGYHQEWRHHNVKEPIEMTAKKLPTLRMLAHDATENEALRHCPFCGAGKIIGRADGSVECEFCHHYFTVQVQPQYPNFPQTINGMPQQIPGMPGQVETPMGAPGMDAGGLPPGQEDPGAGGGPPWAQDGAQGSPDDDAEDKEAEDEEEPPPFAKQSSLPVFRTTAGARLTEDDYVRHLAIRFAPDRDAMIARIREERGNE